MNAGSEAKNLIESERWRLFLESTAAALQINLIFQVIGTEALISVCGACPVCHSDLPALKPFELNGPTLPEPDDTDSEADMESFSLNDKYRIIVRRFKCHQADVGLSFHEKVSIAKELLSSFLIILTDQWSGGQLVSELAALRQINHIILSMFRGENQALEHVLDLILSAAVILFDAGGSWLEYTIDGQKFKITKGTVASGGADIEKGAISVAINSASLHGTMAIVDPLDAERAGTFLGFMVQECSIAFEIDSLLKLMETKMSVVLGTINNLVLLVDKGKVISYANKAAADILCSSIPELIGLSIQDIAAPWRECILQETDRNFKGIKDSLTTANACRYIDWDVYPLAGDRDISGWLVMARDCTDYYRLQEMGEKTERLAGTFDLLNVMAHEIRNPLATIKGLLQIIEAKELSPETKKYIKVGMRELRRLTLLLDDYMKLGRSVVSTAEITDLNIFVSELMPLLSMEFSGEHLHINALVSDVPHVQIDRRQLTQVMINLVKNAYEAMQHQGTIQICLNQDQAQWVELSVADTGPGIPGHIMEKLFKPYFSTKPDGTGLGLTVSQAIIQNHGGDISVRNNPGSGACFTVRLPVFTEDIEEDSNKTDVLLFTDNDVIRMPAMRVLKAEHISAVAVDWQSNVLQAIETYQPSVLFIDESFMDLNNLRNLLKSICSEYGNLRILIASEHEFERMTSNIHCISKPVNHFKFVSIIKALIAQGQ